MKNKYFIAFVITVFFIQTNCSEQEGAKRENTKITLGFLTEKNYPILSKTSVAGDDFFEMLNKLEKERGGRTQRFNALRLVVDALEQRINPHAVHRSVNLGSQIAGLEKYLTNPACPSDDADKAAIKGKITELKNVKTVPMRALLVAGQEISYEGRLEMLRELSKLSHNLDLRSEDLEFIKSRINHLSDLIEID